MGSEKASASKRWSLSELKAALEQLSDPNLAGTKFCFFIDGLDEDKWDGYGGMLGKDHRFVDLLQQDSDCEQIIPGIVHRAQVVFLWVCLVVDKLRDALNYNPDVSALRETLGGLTKQAECIFRANAETTRSSNTKYASPGISGSAYLDF